MNMLFIAKLPRFSLFVYKRKSPYDAFYAWCRKKKPDIKEVSQVILHKDDERRLSDMERKWHRPKHRYMSAKWYEAAFAMHHLCYSPAVLDEHAKKGYVVVREELCTTGATKA